MTGILLEEHVAAYVSAAECLDSGLMMAEIRGRLITTKDNFNARNSLNLLDFVFSFLKNLQRVVYATIF